MWEYSDTNGYPGIILHDCTVEDAVFEEGNLIFTFDESGFWISQDNRQNPYGKILRTGKAELKFVGVDVDFTSINLFKKVRFTNKTLFTKLNEISLKDFVSRMNRKEWGFEIVDEYYALHGAMFCGYIHSKENSFLEYMQFEITYKESSYHWNKIYEDRTW